LFQIFEKKANLRLLLNIQKAKMFQFQGGFAPLIRTQGALLLHLARGSAPRLPL